VHQASRAYQLESSDGAAGMQGVESAALGVETAEESAETAGTAVAGTDIAAAGHNLLSGLLDGTGLPAVR
jgi:2-succinyl-5-enolpyruvyl-6-hydroxy-3-cyclohexene-1-carboxylate synthase